MPRRERAPTDRSGDHDIVGHALNVIILSGAAARRVLETNVSQAKELLTTVEEVGREAFRDLDGALGLADQSPDFEAPKGLADLDELVRRLVEAGMQVEYKVVGSPRAVPRLVDGSAYRIIQESLTNVG
jgi:signal transduction histidine kinase